jgi:shikimate kinase
MICRGQNERALVPGHQRPAGLHYRTAEAMRSLEPFLRLRNARFGVRRRGECVTSSAVSNRRSIHNVALVGFMGTGKTTVGRALAELLEFKFVDTDELIEARTHKRISDIFEQDGEPAFRELEAQVVEELARGRGQMISTGGGLPTTQSNLDSLKSHALVVCLWASAEKVFERVKHQSHRPLLNTPDPLKSIRELLEQRTPYYKQADVLVGTEGRPVREVAQQVATQFHMARNARS